MKKNNGSKRFGFMLFLVFLQQGLLLLLAGYVFQMAGKKSAAERYDMDSELDQRILEARKKFFSTAEM